MRTHIITEAKPRSATLPCVAVAIVCLMTAALGGCAESLPVSALPSRDQIAQPVLDKAAQQQAMDALIRERDERQAKAAQTETAVATRR